MTAQITKIAVPTPPSETVLGAAGEETTSATGSPPTAVDLFFFDTSALVDEYDLFGRRQSQKDGG